MHAPFRSCFALLALTLATSASAAPTGLIRANAPAAPAGARPTYALDLALSDADLTFGGKVRITMTNPTSEPLSGLPMVLHPNATEPGALVIDAIESAPSATLAVGHPSELLVQFASPVPPGGAIDLTLSFHGQLKPLRSDVNDLFVQGMDQVKMLSGAAGGGDFGLLATGDGMTVAASAFPMVVPAVDGAFAHRVLRLDHPIGDLAWNAPARFEARIATPLGLRVVTNGVDRPGPAVDGGQVVLVEADMVGDLVIAAARDWVVAEQDVGGVRVRSWSRARDRAAGKAVLAEGVAALTWLERHLGPYPFTELDLVEASLVGGAGGVEFGSMALIAGFLYADPSASTSPMASLLPMLGDGAASAMPPLAEQRAFVVAHEVAHQWSPGLVGSDAWNHPIVDEPLAQYLAWRVVSEGKSAAAAAEIRDRMVSSGYGMMRLLGTDDGPADRATSGFATSLDYAGLVYGKAPGLYFALEGSVGRTALDRALRRAVAANAWSTVPPERWLGTLEAEGATGAVALGGRWWSEAHGDADLGLDPSGEVALRWMLGRQTAQQLTAVLAPLGMTPAAMLRSMLGGGGLPMPGAVPGAAPGAVPGGLPSVEKLLEQLMK